MKKPKKPQGGSIRNKREKIIWGGILSAYIFYEREYFQTSLGVASAKPVPFVSTLKKAGGAGPQRGSKGEEVTPVPGGGGAGGEVRKELETLIITRRAKSTNPSPSVFTLCVCYPPKCLCSLALMSHQMLALSALHSPARPAY